MRGNCLRNFCDSDYPGVQKRHELTEINQKRIDCFHCPRSNVFRFVGGWVAESHPSKPYLDSNWGEIFPKSVNESTTYKLITLVTIYLLNIFLDLFFPNSTLHLFWQQKFPNNLIQSWKGGCKRLPTSGFAYQFSNCSMVSRREDSRDSALNRRGRGHYRLIHWENWNYI